jgi:AAA15 family ATPase/GTPase
MITSLEILNFRSFGDRATIPLAPITLVLGQNSAGKSSILHALTLLKQTREGRERGAALLPRAECVRHAILITCSTAS